MYRDEVLFFVDFVFVVKLKTIYLYGSIFICYDIIFRQMCPFS